MRCSDKHLKSDLWLENQMDMLFLQYDVGTDVDVAMALRRDGSPGTAVPDGVLTRLTNTPAGTLVGSTRFLRQPAGPNED